MSSERTIRLRPDVHITPLALEHAPNMYRWMCDPTISQNLGLRSEPSAERTEAWITTALQDSSINAYAVLLNGQHVGNVILDHVDTYLSSARLSVYIGEPSARQSGVGATGLYLTLQHGFAQMLLHKVWLTVHSRNFRAINTYSRLGFVLEGILRDEFWLDGQRMDALYMGLLSRDFEQLVARYQ